MSAIMLATLLMPSAFAETTWETFENEDGTLTVTGYNGPGGDVTIPAQIDGKTVGLIASEILVGMSESVKSFSAEPAPRFILRNTVYFIACRIQLTPNGNS